MSKIDYRYGEFKDVSALKKIWIDCFNDTAKGFRTFWKNIQKITRVYVACDGSKPVACVYQIPCTVDGQQCHYLFGAATLNDYRCKGIMKNLIDFSLEDASDRGDKISFLFTANERFEHYYEKLGYAKLCKRKFAAVSRDELMRVAEYGGFCVSMSVNGIYELRNKVLLQNSLKFPIEYIKYSVAATRHYGGYTVCSGAGYAIVKEDKYGECTISELAADEGDLYALLGELLENTNAATFNFNYPTSYKIFENEQILNDGMLKYLSDYKLSEAYIGLRNQ